MREPLRVAPRFSDVYDSTDHTVEMDRVLKRVGLSKKITQSEIKNQDQSSATEDKTKIRRRRRSKSRRRSGQESKKTRGLFNIDWESVKDCKSCKSRAITRRFCSKRCDNELYRSNSFKFERFIRGSEEASTLGKKVSSPKRQITGGLPLTHNNLRQIIQKFLFIYYLHLTFDITRYLNQHTDDLFICYFNVFFLFYNYYTVIH